MPIEDTNAPPEAASPGIKALNEALRVFFVVLKWVMAGTIVFFLFSGVFIVEQHKTALVLRFGEVTGPPGRQVLGPGLHWALPYPIHEVVEIETGRIQETVIDTHWYNETIQTLINQEKGVNKESGELQPGVDGYCITGDTNIVHFKWHATYRVDDPLQYFLNLTVGSDGSGDPALAFIETAVANAVVRQSGRMKIDDILKGGQGEFKEAVTTGTQAILKDMNTGLVLERLDLMHRIQVPETVAAAFEMVNQAVEDGSSRKNKAKAYRNKTVHEAEGEAAAIRGAARGYKARVVASARADADYITSLLEKYEEDPGKLDVYLRQHYIEVLDDVLSNVQAKYIIRGTSKNRGELWIKINKDPMALEENEKEAR